MSTENIRIAIQKSGRLSEDSLKLFKECGIKFEAHGSKLRSVSSNFPIEFLFLRDDDIPGYVEDGVADLGVIGLNVLMEQKRKVDIAKELGYVSTYAIQKAKVLEEELWSVVGVGDVIDISDEILLRYGVSAEQILAQQTKRREFVSSVEAAG